METLFAGRRSPVTNGPAAYGAEPWLGVFAGSRNEQARETWTLGRALGWRGGSTGQICKIPSEEYLTMA